ncbi:transcriptional regulator [Prevotella aurantiaca]|jgi:transcriptional regulator|uniref:transcriptional regulator n=1 Tax=Prevotella aurantiaca TaxID=596085 RepID=UPI0023F061D8|nr:transcriptional regulator [Prevotella aurantiaca]
MRKLLDPFFQNKLSLSVMSILMTNREVAFLYLCEQTGATDEEMNEQLELLEQKGYITTMRALFGKCPRKSCTLEPKGEQVFLDYLEALEEQLK